MKSKILYSLVAVLALELVADDIDRSKQYEISEINIDANFTKATSISTKDEFGGKTTIDRDMIEATPSGNGDITSLLRINPAVKFSNTNKQSTTMGEIDPAQISINGAKFYQNNFSLDGININNDLDPAATNGYDQDNAKNIWNPISSTSQGLAVDSDLIESIEVYDSDISAQYGEFTGGVIEAKTRNPRPGFHGKISMGHTRDRWTKFIIDENDPEAYANFFDSSDASNQPRFKKYRTTLSLDGFLTDDFGLLFSYTNLRSTIPLKTYSSLASTSGKYSEQISKQRRNSDNYLLKALWYASDRLTITPSITYNPKVAKIYRNNAKDSFRDEKSGGLNLALKMDYDFDFMSLRNQFGYSKKENSRDSSNQYTKTWQYSSDKDWGKTKGSSFEGAFGDINMIQKDLVYKSDLDFEAITIGGGSTNS